MFNAGELFQWERFITPSIIKLFYWLCAAIAILGGFYGVISSLALMAYSPIAGFIMAVLCIAGMVAGVVLARIVAEFVLIVFRINEHLGAIRNRGDTLCLVMPRESGASICGRPPACKRLSKARDRIACDHMSGLLTRSRMTAAKMGSATRVPNSKAA